MTSPRRFEQDLPALLADLYVARTPDYRDDLVQQIARVRQRPAWTFPERWLPMNLVIQRVATPGVPWRAIGVLALIALMLAAMLAAYVGSQPRLPAPFGLAANGLVAYVDADGAIAVADPQTGTSRVVVPGSGNDRPAFSPDGTRLAFRRQVAGGGYDIVVSSVDGSRGVALNPEPLDLPSFLVWTPDGESIVSSDLLGNILFYDAARSGNPRVLSESDGTQIRAIISQGGFNANVQSMFHPPNGDQLLFIEQDVQGGRRLVVIDADGSNRRTVLEDASSGIPVGDLASPQWSPDGSQIVVTVDPVANANQWHLVVMNADGSDVRELTTPSTRRSEGNPLWSPDGTRIAFQRWLSHGDGGVDVRPITVKELASGKEIEVGIVNVDGYHGWSWSPDGKAILEVAQNVPERRLQIAPLSGESPLFLDATTDSAPSWQRTAP